MPIPNFNLPADLPQDWTNGQIVSPDGVSVGLTAQHGYNALNQYINDAQKAINQLRDYLETAGFATQDSLDTAVSRLLPKSGGTMTGVINMGKKKITNLATPTGAADSATKGYVDTAVSGFSGLLTGGSIRKIWAGASVSSSAKAVVSSALIFGENLALVIRPPSGSTSSSYDYTPCVLLPSRNSSGEMMLIRYSGVSSDSVNFTCGWYDAGSQTVDGVKYPIYTAGNYNIVARYFSFGFIIVYSPVGFVYAD